MLGPSHHGAFYFAIFASPLSKYFQSDWDLEIEEANEWSKCDNPHGLCYNPMIISSVFFPMDIWTVFYKDKIQFVSTHLSKSSNWCLLSFPQNLLLISFLIPMALKIVNLMKT
jgi:hypothetical protein